MTDDTDPFAWSKTGWPNIVVGSASVVLFGVVFIIAASWGGIAAMVIFVLLTLGACVASVSASVRGAAVVASRGSLTASGLAFSITPD